MKLTSYRDRITAIIRSVVLLRQRRWSQLAVLLEFGDHSISSQSSQLKALQILVNSELSTFGISLAERQREMVFA